MQPLRLRMNAGTTPDAIRGILGQTLYLIRFPIMDSKEYAEGPDKSGILSYEVRAVCSCRPRVDGALIAA